MTWLTYPLSAHQQDDAALASIIDAGLTPMTGSAKGPWRDRAVTLLDTFDRLLAAAGLTCSFDGSMCSVTNAESPQVLAEVELKRCPTSITAAWPDEALRQTLAPILGIRAALPLTTAEWQEQTWDACNANGKKVATLTLICNPNALAIGITPLRGFQAESETIRQQFVALGWQTCPTQPFIARALSAMAQAPQVAAIRDGEAGGLVTLRMVADNTLTIATAQIDGVVADYDTEFLHDYRVNIRRLRSLLTTIKSVLAPEALRELKGLLGDMARATNELRDLDVYLLDQDDLLQRLPSSLAAGGTGLFAIIAKDRRLAQQATSAYLTSQEFTDTLATVQRRLQTLAGADLGPDAATSIATIARNAITKAYKKVIKCGRTIDLTTPEEEVHELRILCKKLRYTIDFFGSILQPQSAKALKKYLKKLQDLLGTFNDRSVQEEKLLSILDNRLSNSAKSRAIAASIGALIGALERERLATRPGIIAAFKDFSNKRIRHLVADLTRNPAPLPEEQA